MEELGGYHELAPSARGVGVALFLFALFFTALLERLQFRLRDQEGSRWWASSGRDLLNALALLAMTFGLRAIGFAGPISLAIAATLFLALSVVQSSLARSPRLAAGLSIALSLFLGLPVLLAPRAVQGFFLGTIELLF